MRLSARHPASIRTPDHARRILKLALCLAPAALIAIGCASDDRKKAEPPPPRYPTLPPKTNVPPFMKGTIYEVADMDNKTPYLVSGYGLVVGLDGTGDNTDAPPAVRNM